jgi:hypothetical protein
MTVRSAAEARMRLVAAPLVHRLGHDHHDALRPKEGKRTKVQKARYAARIDTAIAALTAVTGVPPDAIAVGATSALADQGPTYDPDAYESALWAGIPPDAPRLEMFHPTHLAFHLGRALAHAYDQEVDVWVKGKRRSRTATEETFISTVETWCFAIDTFTHCGEQPARYMAEHALGQVRPTRDRDKFWTEYYFMFWSRVDGGGTLPT